MKKALSFFTLITVAALLSGCIVTKTPNTNDVTMTVGEQMTFSVLIFPPTTTFAWTLDGTPLSNTGNSYVYTAQGGGHFLIVRATHILGTDTQAWYIYGNSPPVADAGADQWVYVDTTVTLNGSRSTDPDNNIVSYHWQQTAGPAVTLTNPEAAIAQFTAAVVAGSVLNFELTVTDAGGESSRDVCAIRVIGTTPANPQVSAGASHTVGLKSDGTVLAVGNNSYGQCNVETWSNVIQVVAEQPAGCTIGLRQLGTVLYVGYDDYGVGNSVRSWTGISGISAGHLVVVGLKPDGTVIAVGNCGFGQCNVGSWTSIVQVSVGCYHTVGLNSERTVVAVGWNSDGQCNVESWTDIIQISAGQEYTVGLRSDGTVVAVGNNDYGQCDVSDWTGITQVSAGELHTAGLRSDGTVVTVGDNFYGQCNVGGWNLIVSP